MAEGEINIDNIIQRLLEGKISPSIAQIPTLGSFSMVESWTLLVSFPLCHRNTEIFVGNGIFSLQWEEAGPARQSRWLRPRCEDSVSSPGNSSSSNQSCWSWRLHWKYVVSNNSVAWWYFNIITWLLVCWENILIDDKIFYLSLQPKLVWYIIIIWLRNQLNLVKNIFIKISAAEIVSSTGKHDLTITFRWYSRAIHRPAETVRVRRVPTRG